MADRTTELKEVLAAAKKGHAFGLALGGKDEPVILTSNTKRPDALQLAAKAQVGGKIGAGTMEFEGGRLVLKFVEDPPVGCQRTLKTLFKTHKVKVKIALMLPNGSLEEDLDDEDSPVEAAPSEGAEVENPELARLREMFAGLEPLLQQQAQADPSRAEQIGKLISAFHTLSKADPPDIDKLARVAAAAQQALPKPDRALSQAAPPPELASLQEAMKRTVTLAAEAARANMDLVAPLRSHAAAFQTATAAQPPDLSAARVALDGVQRLVPKPGRPLSTPAPATATEKPAPATDVEKMQQSMKQIVAKAKTAAAADPSLVPKILEQARIFGAALGAEPPDTEAARKAMIAMQALVPKPSNQTAPELASADFEGARTAWAHGIHMTTTEINRLEQSIAKAVEGLPGAGRIAKPMADIRSVVSRLDTAMTDALKGSDQTSKTRALDLRGKIAGVVNQHPVLSQIDINNPFIATAIVRYLNNALHEVEQAMA